MFFEVGLTIFAHLLIASFDYLILHTLDIKDSDSSLYLLQTFFFLRVFYYVTLSNIPTFSSYIQPSTFSVFLYGFFLFF